MSDDRDLLLHVCAAPADEAWVEGYLKPSLGLAEGQVHTRHDDRLGHPRVDEIAEATTRARYTLLVLSQAFLSDGLSDYITSLATHVAVREKRLLLVSREACALPLQLDYLVRLECHENGEVDQWPAEMARLRALLGQPEPPDVELPCPYPGMKPFGAEQRDLFFGRDAEVEELYQRVRKPGCHLFVIGPSGSGKSSLLRAGLLARLADDARRQQKAQFRVVNVRPAQAPMAALGGALGQAEGRPLGEAVGALLEGTAEERVLLLVDPLEELFTQGDEGETRRFLEALRTLQNDPRCTLVTAMRADFYPQLMSSALWPLRPGQRIELGSLPDDDLRQAIRQPAAARGVYVEPALLERLAHEASHGVGVLPLLQETLRLLWQRREERREQRLLTLASYEALRGSGQGGAKASALQVALARHADSVLATLPEGGEAIARRLFVRLVRLGEGGPDTRRQQPAPALSAASDDPARFAAVMRHLVEGRLITLSGAETQVGRLVDLAHEALIKGWPTLAAWLHELREAEQTRRRLEARGQGGLLDATELPEFEAWVKSALARELGLDPALVELVRRSRAALTRRKRALYGAGATLFAFLVVVTVMTINLYHQQQLTQKSLAAALGVANDITFTIERDLEPIAGASVVRGRLLARSLELLGDLNTLAGPQANTGRTNDTTLIQKTDLLLDRGKVEEKTKLHQDALYSFAQRTARDPADAEWQRELSIARNKVGGVAMAAGKLDHAYRAFQARLAIAQRLTKSDPTNVDWQRDLSISYERLGGVAMAAGKLDQAQRAFQAGLAIAQRLTKSDPTNADWQRDLSVAHERLGDVAVAAGKLDEAQRAFQAGLAIAQKLAAQGPTNADWQRDLSIAHERLGDVAVAAGKLDEAQRAFHASLAIRQWLVERDPTNAGWQRDLSVAHERLGDVAMAAGKLDEAQRAFHASLAIRQRLAAEEPTNASWQRDLSVAHEKLGDVAVAAGKFDEAQRTFHASLAIRQWLVERDSTSIGWQRDLSVAYEKLGDMAVAAGKLDEAQDAFRASLAIAQKLAERDPTNAGWQHDLSGTHEKIGGAAMAAGKLDEAQRAFQVDLAIMQKLAAQGPTNADWQHDLSIAHERLGDVAAAAGKLDEAQRAFRASLDIMQKLATQDPMNADWRKDLLLSHGRLADVAASLQRRGEAQAHYREAIIQMASIERDGLLREDAQMPKIRSSLAALQQRHQLTPVAP